MLNKKQLNVQHFRFEFWPKNWLGQYVYFENIFATTNICAMHKCTQWPSYLCFLCNLIRFLQQVKHLLSSLECIWAKVSNKPFSPTAARGGVTRQSVVSCSTPVNYFLAWSKHTDVFRFRRHTNQTNALLKYGTSIPMLSTMGSTTSTSSLTLSPVKSYTLRAASNSGWKYRRTTSWDHEKKWFEKNGRWPVALIVRLLETETQ